MQVGVHYPSAPISEAILEFQVTNPDGLTIDDLAVFSTQDDFATATPIFNIHNEVAMADDGVVTGVTRGEQVGLSFSRQDNLRLVQAGLDRFAFVWRGRYEGWNAFAHEAETHWLAYREVARPKIVRFVGVRFVNHIPMPRPTVEIKDYLRTSVDVSTYLPQAVTGLFMQVDVPLLEEGVNATITSAMLTGEQGGAGGLSILLDIDVKKLMNADTSSGGFDKLMVDTLDTLRFAKNFVFEACITDATRGLIS